jgi:hydrogenase-4 component F
MYFDGEDVIEKVPAPLSRWCVAPMWLALAPLLVFGLWWPSGLWSHFMLAAHSLAGQMP